MQQHGELLTEHFRNALGSWTSALSGHTYLGHFLRVRLLKGRCNICVYVLVCVRLFVSLPFPPGTTPVLCNPRAECPWDLASQESQSQKNHCVFKLQGTKSQVLPQKYGKIAAARISQKQSLRFCGARNKNRGFSAFFSKPQCSRNAKLWDLPSRLS